MIPFAIPSKKNKIPMKKFNQGDERPIYWQLMTLMEKKWRDQNGKTLCSYIGRINIIKISILPNL